MRLVGRAVLALVACAAACVEARALETDAQVGVGRALFRHHALQAVLIGIARHLVVLDQPFVLFGKVPHDATGKGSHHQQRGDE